jgi:hypothetical protein
MQIPTNASSIIREKRMKVSVKDLAVTMDLGNNGIELDVYDNDGNALDYEDYH